MINKFKVEKVSGEIDYSLPVRFQISMFSQHCTGKYLYAMLNWVGNQNIENIELQISDTLQKYNLIWRKKIEPIDAKAMADQVGIHWLQDNRNAIWSALENFDKVSVSHWENFTRHAKFKDTVLKFQDLYDNDIGFRGAVVDEVNGYFIRINRSATKARKELSTQYLIEELAVSEITSRYMPANEIYPGPRHKAEIYLCNSGILEHDFFLRDMSFIQLNIIDLRS